MKKYILVLIIVISVIIYMQINSDLFISKKTFEKNFLKVEKLIKIKGTKEIAYEKEQKIRILKITQYDIEKKNGWYVIPFKVTNKFNRKLLFNPRCLLPDYLMANEKKLYEDDLLKLKNKDYNDVLDFLNCNSNYDKYYLKNTITNNILPFKRKLGSRPIEYRTYDYHMKSISLEKKQSRMFYVPIAEYIEYIPLSNLELIY